MSLISIIIPLYNKKDCIYNTIQSVLNQSYKDFELIVVDDGSTDNSAEIVRSFNNDKIHYILKNNNGPSSARNLGVQKASGEWILFLDADDELLSNALAIFVQLINSHPEIKCFSSNHYIKFNGKRNLYTHFYKNGFVKNAFKLWVYQRFMPRAGAAIFKKSTLNGYHYNEKLRRYEDADVLFRMMRNEKFYSTSQATMIYNCDSLAASHAREYIYEDFLGHLYIAKNKWERIAILDLFLQCKKIYPTQYKDVYAGRKFCSVLDLFRYRYSKLMNELLGFINRILNKL